MSANLIVYCLEQVDDYFQFERMCNDLMALDGFSNIEPIGGTKDKGRDALHKDRSSGRVSIFAYSVREDWRAKLAEDAGKIEKHGHKCHTMIFVTTAKISPAARDEAIASVLNVFGWELEIYGLERLRVMLEAQYPQVKWNHPAIFPPEFLKYQETSVQSTTHKEYVELVAAVEDAAFADWLARRLSVEGYAVYSQNLPDFIFEGETEKQTSQTILIGSEGGLSDPNFLFSIGGRVTNGNSVLLNMGTRAMNFPRVLERIPRIEFTDHWIGGFKKLLLFLEEKAVPKGEIDGKSIAVNNYFEDELISGKGEKVFSNLFRITKLPERIWVFLLKRKSYKRKIEDTDFKWAFRRLSHTMYAALEEPPPELISEFEFTRKVPYLWSSLENVEGVNSRYLMSELIRKSLLVHAARSGLEYCAETRQQYFPADTDGYLRRAYFHPIENAPKRPISFNGKRKYYHPIQSEDYCYFLSPEFSISMKLGDPFVLILRIRVRLTDTQGKPLTGRKIVSRRKHLCKNWWNNDWGNRILAVSQFFCDDGIIKIGEVGNELIVDGTPILFDSAKGLREEKLGELKEREYINQFDEEDVE